MGAFEELKTIIDVSKRVRDEPDDTSVVCQLLEQWKARHSVQEQTLAWPQVKSELHHHGLSSGLVWWLLRAEQRGELGQLQVDVPNLCQHGNISSTDEVLQLLLNKMQHEMKPPFSKEWKDAARVLFYRIRDWGKDNDPLNPSVLQLIEKNRQYIASQDLAWSEELCANLPKKLRTHLYTDINGIAAQQKIIKEIERGFLNHIYGRFNSVQSVERFLNKIDVYSLEEQTQKDGLLYPAIVNLLNQCNSECLPPLINYLTNKGWKRQKIWNSIHPTLMAEKCHQRDHEYIDTLNALANPQQRKRLFTWVVEGLANYLYQNTPTKILKEVQLVLSKPYAQPTVFEINFHDLRDYTDYIMRLWMDDPKMSAKHPYDRYAGSGLNLTSCEEFLAVNLSHFSSPIMQQAVDLLNTVTHPSLQGMLEFWGRLHNIDFGISKPQTFTLSGYSCAGRENGDAHLLNKAQEVAQRIAIGGNLQARSVAKTRKI